MLRMCEFWLSNLTRWIVGAINFAAEYLGWYGGSVSKVMFFVELVCLVAFGIAWFVAGKQLSYFASSGESKGLEWPNCVQL